MSKIIALLYKRQITLIQQTLYTTINFVKKDLEGKIINFTKQIVTQTTVTLIAVILIVEEDFVV